MLELQAQVDLLTRKLDAEVTAQLGFFHKLDSCYWFRFVYVYGSTQRLFFSNRWFVFTNIFAAADGRQTRELEQQKLRTKEAVSKVAEMWAKQKTPGAAGSAKDSDAENSARQLEQKLRRMQRERMVQVGELHTQTPNQPNCKAHTMAYSHLKAKKKHTHTHRSGSRPSCACSWTRRRPRSGR